MDDADDDALGAFPDFLGADIEAGAVVPLAKGLLEATEALVAGAEVDMDGRLPEGD